MTERFYPSCPFNSSIACKMKLIHRDNPCAGCNNYNENAFIEKVETTGTFTNEPCKHIGYYHTVEFLCFKRKFLACENCGKLIPQTKWRLSV